MNVCMIASGYPSRSAPLRDIFIHYQAREMVSKGMNVQVIALGDDDGPADETVEGVRVHRVMRADFKPGRLLPFAFAARVARKAVRLHRAEGFDIVHSHFADHAGFAGAIVSRVLRKPFVLTVHGYDVNYSKELGYGFGVTWPQRVFVFLVLRSANKVCPVSNALRRRCIERWLVDPARLQVVHDGTAVEGPPDEQGLRRLRADLGLNGSKVILSVSSLLKVKGQQNVLRALPTVVSEVPDAVFLMLGEGPYLGELRKLVAELGIERHVRIVNRYAVGAELALFLGLCDVFVLASILEGFGIVYLDASALGKPVIGSRGQGDEDFIVDGRNGFLVEPGDTEALAGRITLLLRDERLRLEMGHRAREAVQQGFLWRHNVEKLTAVYGELTGRGHQ